MPQERGRVQGFIEAWNIFRVPMSLTLKATGRVQDLLAAGAPMTPDKMPESIQKSMTHLGQNDRQDFTAFATQTSEIGTNMNNFMGLVREMQGATKEWQSVQQIMLARVKQAKKAGKEEELKKLTEPYETLSKIVDMGVEVTAAFVTMGESELGSMTGIEAGSDAKIYEMGKKRVTSAIKDNLSTKAEIFMIIGGDAAKAGSLKHEIAKLEQQIAVAGINAEELHIDAAKAQLAGVSQQMVSQALEIGSNSRQSRRAALDFGKEAGDTAKTGKGDRTKIELAALIAQAYQELRTFGEAAYIELGPLAPKIGSLGEVIGDHAEQIKITRRHPEFASGTPDFEDLILARNSTKKYGTLLEQQIPDWRTKANLWRAFFTNAGLADLDEVRVPQ
jgi:hypothetical protein